MNVYTKTPHFALYLTSKTIIMKRLVILFCTFCIIFQLNAQDQQTPSPIIFIYDASGSMWGQIDGKTKMQIATDVLSTSVNNLPENQKIGLVAYGHREKGDCKDVEFLVDVATGTRSQINQSLTKIKPLGKTPLAYSATQVIGKLRDAKMKATVILVTDGIESCDGDICEVVKAAKAEGIDFRMHIIGFGLKAGETEQLKCAAEAGDGKYYDAADAGGLGDVLNEATTATVDEPAANFSVYATKNGKAVDAYVRAFKPGTKASINGLRTYGDTTLMYLPPGNYDLEARALENSDVAGITIPNVKIVADQITHQNISFDGGKISVITLNNGEGWDAVVKIFAKGNAKSVAGGRTYGKVDEYEVNPGVYDVEVAALIIEGVATSHKYENVEVKANGNTEVKHNFKSGIAMIGAKSASGLVDAVVKVIEVNTKKNVASGRTYTRETNNPKKFTLNPGTYEVTLVALGDHKGKKETYTLVVKAGETMEKMTTF
ncbi:MAG: hypothetical protein DHS20C18_32140 [Saprospiraceae bacterium]|nr:MAG: hypothetical protein DHS20C18_32140 [Saprospiraceae bacterium]